MARLGICGHFGGNKQYYDGQTVKTKILFEELKVKFGENNIFKVDTYNWKKKPFELLINCIKLLKRSDDILILPAHKGLKVILPLFLILNTIFKKRLHYIVIGGWLYQYIKDNKYLLKYLKELDTIVVETEQLKKDLLSIGFNNVIIVPNFKRLKIVREEEIKKNFKKPYPLCMFSRIMPEKGIEDAINTIIKINRENNEIIFTLDIYGKVDNLYNDKFNKLMLNVPDFIKYKGQVPYHKSVDILNKYFLLLFPTRFFTEGIPGTIIDAFASGVPVISSEWQSVNDIVENRVTGLIYKFNDIKDFEDKLLYALNNENEIINMRKNCIAKAWEFHPDNVINILVERINQHD